MAHPGGNDQPPSDPPVAEVAELLSVGEAPAPVREFAEALLQFVHRAVGMTLDYREETLPVVDHYLEQARMNPVASGTGAAALSPQLRDLLAPAAGCYFGEVLRRKFGGHWILDGGDPVGWRLGLAPCYLVLHPVAMGACALAGGEVEGIDDNFATSARETPSLDDALEAAAPIDEETYYSLGGRLDIISYAADFLMAQAIEHGTACTYPASAYREG